MPKDYYTDYDYITKRIKTKPQLSLYGYVFRTIISQNELKPNHNLPEEILLTSLIISQNELKPNHNQNKLHRECYKLYHKTN